MHIPGLREILQRVVAAEHNLARLVRVLPMFVTWGKDMSAELDRLKIAVNNGADEISALRDEVKGRDAQIATLTEQVATLNNAPAPVAEASDLDALSARLEQALASPADPAPAPNP
jgi:hypothetical protein